MKLKAIVPPSGLHLEKNEHNKGYVGVSLDKSDWTPFSSNWTIYFRVYHVTLRGEGEALWIASNK